MSGPLYAIDFGTSNTVITRQSTADAAIETIHLDDLSIQQQGNPPLVPSLIYIEQAAAAASDYRAIVGQAVRDRGLDMTHDPRFFRNVKRGIGTPVQGFIPEIDGYTPRFEQVGQRFLTAVISAIKAKDVECRSLVFTVPVDSFETYRLWLGNVCRSLDIDQVRLVDEPTAAALGYTLDADCRTLLVVDFGGGTLDFSLVQPTFELAEPTKKPLGFLLKWGKQTAADSSTDPTLSAAKRRSQTVRVLAKAGENLGGADIDRWITEWFAQEQSLPTTPLTLRLSEKLKIALSTQQQASEAYFEEDTLESYDLSLDRDRLRSILSEHQFFDRLDRRLDDVLQQAQRQNVAKDDIDAVLLVGGSAQLPAIQSWIEGHFDSEKVRSDRPFDAVARGALQLQQTQLQDFLYHSYGIRYWNRQKNSHSWHPLIQRGQPYPMSDPVELLLGASSEKQPSIELILGELSDAQPSRTEVYFEGNQLVTRQVQRNQQTVQPLNDREGARTIANLTPPGYPGSDRVRLLFTIDSDRCLRLTVEDILTGDTLMQNEAVVQLN